MPAKDSLPVLLVSAADEDAAATIISELIDHEVTQEYDESKSSRRVWRLQNKYYQADICLWPHVDGDELAINEKDIEAHIIYLDQHECTEEKAQSRMLSKRRGVRLVLARCKEASNQLLSWGSRHRYEVVPLLEIAEEDDKQFHDSVGMDRAREALHAHVWVQAGDAGNADSADSTEDELEVTAEDEDDEVDGLTDAFVAAMSVLPALAQPRELGSLPRVERLQRAEELVRAFCSALGTDPDTL